MRVVASQSLMTRALVEALAAWNVLDVPDTALASALGVPPRSLARWRGGMVPQTAVRRRLDLLAALHQALLDSFGDLDDARAWLHDDSRYLGGLKPIEVLRSGRLDRVRAALAALDAGVFL